VKNSSKYEGAPVVDDACGHWRAQQKAHTNAPLFNAIFAMKIMPRRLINHAFR
jgi:hypothetical protein